MMIVLMIAVVMIIRKMTQLTPACVAAIFLGGGGVGRQNRDRAAEGIVIHPYTPYLFCCFSYGEHRRNATQDQADNHTST